MTCGYGESVCAKVLMASTPFGPLSRAATAQRYPAGAQDERPPWLSRESHVPDTPRPRNSRRTAVPAGPPRFCELVADSLPPRPVIRLSSTPPADLHLPPGRCSTPPPVARSHTWGR